MNRLDEFSKQFMKKRIPKFEVGDTVDVVIKIMEEAGKDDKSEKNEKGEKERRQTFTGTVISKKNRSLDETFIVRRIVQGEGVERVFPLHSPKIVTIKVKRKGKVRRAKLFYLRDRVGKATKVEEKIWDIEEARLSAKEAEEAAKEQEQSDKKSE